METKFHLLMVGQHFEWEGKSYVKSTPLIATQVPEGGQKFMPRAALVSVTGSEEKSAPAIETPARLDSATVHQAIRRYHQRCVQISETHCPLEGEAISQLHAELERIYRDLLNELKLSLASALQRPPITHAVSAPDPYTSHAALPVPHSTETAAATTPSA